MHVKDLKINKPPSWTDSRCEMMVGKHYQWREGK
jgi:hypothetical protein